LFIQDANFAKLTSMHFYSWKKGLKTGMYYLRTKAAADAIKFTVQAQAEPQLKASVPAGVVLDQTKDQNMSDMLCSLDNPEACEACGS
jgi:ribonucleoside-diphosphate reductase alpha chain